MLETLQRVLDAKSQHDHAEAENGMLVKYIENLMSSTKGMKS